jgi:hypothetical protein
LLKDTNLFDKYQERTLKLAKQNEIKESDNKLDDKEQLQAAVLQIYSQGPTNGMSRTVRGNTEEKQTARLLSPPSPLEAKVTTLSLPDAVTTLSWRQVLRPS